MEKQGKNKENKKEETYEKKTGKKKEKVKEERMKRKQEANRRRWLNVQPIYTFAVFTPGRGGLLARLDEIGDGPPD